MINIDYLTAYELRNLGTDGLDGSGSGSLTRLQWRLQREDCSHLETWLGWKTHTQAHWRGC